MDFETHFFCQFGSGLGASSYFNYPFVRVAGSANQIFVVVARVSMVVKLVPRTPVVTIDSVDEGNGTSFVVDVTMDGHNVDEKHEKYQHDVRPDDIQVLNKFHLGKTEFG
jgi:hypothetical protein